MNDLSSTKRRPQVTLMTLLLLVAAVAVWLANVRTNKETQRYTSQLPGLQKLNRELLVYDPSQFTTVGKIPEWNGEAKGEIWVPSGKAYVLCMALDGVQNAPVLPEPEVETPIAAGQHSIEFFTDQDKKGTTYTVKLDGEVALTQWRPKDWEPRTGFSGGANWSTSRQHENDAPWELFRRRFSVQTGKNTWGEPKSPGPGMLVWIDESATR